jgi:glycosyltransferase involved in cell wall biosynthesis
MKKIVIFPNDPIADYYKKGEIKAWYYNPDNFFDEVHIISLAKKDIDPALVREIAGTAKLFIYPVGNPLSSKGLFGFPFFIKKVLRLVKNINPQVLRGYNSTLGGFLTTFAGKKLNIPSVVSLHINQDEIRKFEKAGLKAKIYRSFSKFFLEPFSMKNASIVITVSSFLSLYAKKYGAKNIKVIYNRVYTKQFKKPDNFLRKDPDFKILAVGQLSLQKNMECLIRAVALLDSKVKFTIIGSGPQKMELEKLAEDLGIKEKVIFIPSVPNKEIQKYYWQADIFAIASIHEGFCIPVLEAMASGLPAVVADKEPLPEILGGAGLVVKNNPENFKNAFKLLIEDSYLRKELAVNAVRRAQKLDGEIMERKETELYQSLLKKQN